MFNVAEFNVGNTVSGQSVELGWGGSGGRKEKSNGTEK